ncbi:MAG: hypothetical protein EB057_04990 [Microbacteriaceae bacterium]|nr:hypothetical protein [Microbacteriaceae bacterium]
MILGFTFLGSVLFIKELFVALIALACAAGAWELSTALRQKNWYVPRIPVTVGSALVMPLAYIGGELWQWLGVLAIVAALMLWRGVQLVLSHASFKRSFSEIISFSLF